MTTPQCNNCRFWLRDDGVTWDDIGLCHRHAPSPTKGGFENDLLEHLVMLSWHFTSENYPDTIFQVEETVVRQATWWPATWGDKWCGEHEPKELSDEQ